MCQQVPGTSSASKAAGVCSMPSAQLMLGQRLTPEQPRCALNQSSHVDLSAAARGLHIKQPLALAGGFLACITSQQRAGPMAKHTFKTAGNLKTHITVTDGVHLCGHITDGVAISEHWEGEYSPSWIMDFTDLQRWYLAAKATRDALGKPGVQS